MPIVCLRRCHDSLDKCQSHQKLPRGAHCTQFRSSVVKYFKWVDSSDRPHFIETNLKHCTESFGYAHAHPFML